MRIRVPRDQRDVQREISRLAATTEAAAAALDPRYAPAEHNHDGTYLRVEAGAELEHRTVFLS